MDRNQLQQERIQRRAVMFNQGFLNDNFRLVESLEAHEPNFVEKMIVQYFPSSGEYIRKLEAILNTRPLNLAGMEYFILKLKGCSASFGARKVNIAITEMLEELRRRPRDTDRLGAALGMVEYEQDDLRSHLEPYLEILIQLRGDGPPDVESDTNDDSEKSDSEVIDAEPTNAESSNSKQLPK